MLSYINAMGTTPLTFQLFHIVLHDIFTNGDYLSTFEIGWVDLVNLRLVLQTNFFVRKGL